MSPATITLLFLAFAVVMFVTEKIPLGLTSMIVCVGLCVTKVLDVKTAFAGFIDSNVILFVAMFIVGGAFFETGMANEIGGIVTKFAKTERSLIVAIMVIVGLMSGVLSNTGTAAVLIPVVIGIAAKSGFKRSRLLMPLVFAAAMGGNLSLIGAPGNMIAQSALEPLGMKFGFFEYAIVGLPILAVGILFYATIGFRLLPNHDVTDDGDSVFDNQRDFSNVPKWKKTLSLVILIATLAAMVFEDQIGIKLCVSGCVGAILLILTGVISEKEALKSIDLKTIFLFGGTLSLAATFPGSGPAGHRRWRNDCRQGDRRPGRQPLPAPLYLRRLHSLLCHDQLHVQHCDDCTDGSHLSLHRTGHGCRSPRGPHGLRYRRILCIRNTDRHAGQHNGRRSRRLQIHGLCKVRLPADHHRDHRQHDHPADRFPLLPCIRSMLQE